MITRDALWLAPHMIRYDSSTLWGVLCGFKGSVVKVVAFQTLLTMLVAIGATIWKIRKADAYIFNNAGPWTVVGGCLAFLLVFRTTISYNRYWTAQSSLDAIVQGSREMMSMAVVFTGARPRRLALRRCIVAASWQCCGGIAALTLT